MLLRDLRAYIDADPGDAEIGVAVCSAETGASFAVVADIGECGELTVSVEI